MIEKNEDFPEEFEFLSFFETEPKLLDPGMPWWYNTCTFEYSKDRDNLTFIIDPASGDVKIYWEKGGQKIIELDISFVKICKIFKTGEKEYMILKFQEESTMEDLILQIRPFISITWKSTLDN